jgi:CubicO group peptidase (beta-lactamase class C family)
MPMAIMEITKNTWFKKMRFKEPSGVYWDYRSGDTQVLGLVVEKAFGDNISNLVSEKFLQPMGAEVDALWLLDGDQKHEKSILLL